MKPTFSIYTLGCKVNQYESQVMRERLYRAGWRENPRLPELVVINTCAVTARAEAKGRKVIRRFHRRFPQAKIAITGCGLTLSEPQNRSRYQLIPAFCREGLPRLKFARGEEGITFFANHRRAFLKIQDGCDSFCSYCVIPYLRGASRSRSPDKIRAEMISLLDYGYREIVLTGIRLGRYGLNLNRGCSLVELLNLLLEEKGSFRIRLSSIELKETSPPLFDLLKNNPRLCPHLHIPLQSESDKVLKKINRPYTYRDYRCRVGALKETCPEISVTTDIIVGFPTETEGDFERTARAVEELGFSKVHIFPYSRREGTKAANFPELPPRVVRRRIAYLTQLSRRMAESFRSRFLAQEVEVLFERRREAGDLVGWDEHYLRIIASAKGVEAASLCRVKITAIGPEACRGRVVSRLAS